MTLEIPLVEIEIIENPNFVEEPVGIMNREIKRAKRIRIPLVKVSWNAKRRPEFTWDREEHSNKKYPHLFTRLFITYFLA